MLLQLEEIIPKCDNILASRLAKESINIFNYEGYKYLGCDKCDGKNIKCSWYFNARNSFKQLRGDKNSNDR